MKKNNFLRPQYYGVFIFGCGVPHTYTYGTVAHVPSIPEWTMCIHSTRRYFQNNEYHNT